MKPFIRPSRILIFLMAGSSGCSGISTTIATAPAERAVPAFRPAAPAPAALPLPASLADYKSQVAHHLLQHNPDLHFAGTLPPLMPAIVVLEITVDRSGQVVGAQVQRSRDENASRVALESLWRSTPLPPPRRLAAGDGTLTFMETFLFGERYRYQLRSLEPLQASN